MNCSSSDVLPTPASPISNILKVWSLGRESKNPHIHHSMDVKTTAWKPVRLWFIPKLAGSMGLKGGGLARRLVQPHQSLSRLASVYHWHQSITEPGILSTFPNSLDCQTITNMDTCNWELLFQEFIWQWSAMYLPTSEKIYLQELLVAALWYMYM